MEDQETIEDHFLQCRGKHNDKFTEGIYLWVCKVDPKIPCSKRYSLRKKESYEGRHFCRYINPKT